VDGVLHDWSQSFAAKNRSTRLSYWMAAFLAIVGYNFSPIWDWPVVRYSE